MEGIGFIYIMTNKNKTTLYIGVTNDLQRRVLEHKNHLNKKSFTALYNLDSCVYYEYYPSIERAIERETQLKKWNRVKKELLITSMNPEWNDLWEKIRKMVY
ncbi:endonuclease [Bacteroidia bacterium]|nr:endonuclease [Bacteroidia bacterium]GHT03369.1 endonuclease [Bacteroidia bacterium]GHT45184.1 endonuclease [Bacteroidia bacterium]